MKTPQSVTLNGVDVRWDGRSFVWTSTMECDADGSPRAYASIGSGLKGIDDLRNAGWPGRGYGLAKNRAGQPYVQQAGDPYPGMYVSQVPLQDTQYADSDPRRYADPEAVCFTTVCPELEEMGIRIGDLGIARRGDFKVGIIVGDVAPHKALGESSILTHQVLGVDPFRGRPRHLLLGYDGDVTFRIFPGTASSPRWPRSDVQSAALALESMS